MIAVLLLLEIHHFLFFWHFFSAKVCDLRGAATVRCLMGVGEETTQQECFVLFAFVANLL